MKKLTRREFVQTGSGTALAASVAPAALATAPPAVSSKHGSKKFRIAVIGVGNRGRLFLKASLDRFNVDVPALCDFREEAARRGVKMVREKLGYEPDTYTDGPKDYQRLLKRDDVDAVFITTPTWWHGPMAVDSLRAHKHVFSEVPACNTIQEGWDLVRAAQETDAKYFMAENLCFTRSNMMILNAVEQGVFGTLSFAECGYIHEARNLQFNEDGSLNWRGSLNSRTDLIANTYPTHALGPTSMWFGIPRGDQLRQCVSMMTPARSFRDYAIERFGPDSPGATATWNGDNTVSLIRTESGAVIFLRFDICSPRPHHMDFYTLQGTQGLVRRRSGDVRRRTVEGMGARGELLRPLRSSLLDPAWGSGISDRTWRRRLFRGRAFLQVPDGRHDPGNRRLRRRHLEFPHPPLGEIRPRERGHPGGARLH